MQSTKEDKILVKQNANLAQDTCSLVHRNTQNWTSCSMSPSGVWEQIMNMMEKVIRLHYMAKVRKKKKEENTYVSTDLCILYIHENIYNK